MSLAGQINLLATRIATEFNTLRGLLAGKEPTISTLPGNATQFWRGDKTWQSLKITDIANTWQRESARVCTRLLRINGSGAANSIALSGLLTIDGVTLVAGDRVLVADQSTASTNGIYVAAAAAWTRAPDANTTAGLAGAVVYVREGTVNAGSMWQTSFPVTGTIGTTAVPWQYYARSTELTTLVSDQGLSDTGFVNFTCGAGTGLFAGSTAGVSLSRYRILNGWTTVQISRNVATAQDNTVNPNYPNSAVTATGAVPQVARPAAAGYQNIYALGSLNDLPATCAISSVGTVFVVGGGLRAFAVGEPLDVQFVFPAS